MELLDPVYIALVTFRRREYDTCIDVCTGILDRNPYDEAVWSLKTRALTAQVPIRIPAKFNYLAPIPSRPRQADMVEFIALQFAYTTQPQTEWSLKSTRRNWDRTHHLQVTEYTFQIYQSIFLFHICLTVQHRNSVKPVSYLGDGRRRGSRRRGHRRRRSRRQRNQTSSEARNLAQISRSLVRRAIPSLPTHNSIR